MCRNVAAFGTKKNKNLGIKMQGRNQSSQGGNRFRAHMAKLMLGGAVSCLLAAPAAAQGYATPVSWSGFYVSAGIGAAAMSADTKVDARRDDDVNLRIFCADGESSCEFDGPGDPGSELKLKGDGAAFVANLNFLQQQMLD